MACRALADEIISIDNEKTYEIYVDSHARIDYRKCSFYVLTNTPIWSKITSRDQDSPFGDWRTLPCLGRFFFYSGQVLLPALRALIFSTSFGEFT